MASQQRLMGDVLGDRRFAHSVGPGQDDVGRLLDEAQLHQFLDQWPVDRLWPGPLEVGHRLEPADLGVTDAALKAPPAPFRLLALDQGHNPRLIAHLVPARQQAVQAETPGAVHEWIRW